MFFVLPGVWEVKQIHVYLQNSSDIHLIPTAYCIYIIQLRYTATRPTQPYHQRCVEWSDHRVWTSVWPAMDWPSRLTPARDVMAAGEGPVSEWKSLLYRNAHKGSGGLMSYQVHSYSSGRGCQVSSWSTNDIGWYFVIARRKTTFWCDFNGAWWQRERTDHGIGSISDASPWVHSHQSWTQWGGGFEEYLLRSPEKSPCLNDPESKSWCTIKYLN